MKYLLLVPSLFLAAIIIGFVVRVFERLRFRKHTVIAEYEAPHLLSAAELGYLFDRDFGKNELLATVLALVQKQMVLVRKNSKQNPLLVARKDVEDYKLKELDNGELAVWSWLRSRPHRSIEWDNLSSMFSSKLGGKASFEHEVRQGLVQKGYLRQNPSWFSFSSDYAMAALLVSFGVIFALTVYYFSAVNLSGQRDGFDSLDKFSGFLLISFLVLCFWFPIIFTLRLLFLTYYASARRPVATTKKFHAHWHDVAGFYEFVRTVEFSRMDVDPNPYDKAMPYAVALGFKPDLDKMSALAAKGKQ